ncbi:MAG: hypothetical protein IAG10_24350 [Planctomycetaceae bacterium]|nr:hypothetical protein [Planctomycetaceae bacterium]
MKLPLRSSLVAVICCHWVRARVRNRSRCKQDWRARRSTSAPRQSGPFMEVDILGRKTAATVVSVATAPSRARLPGETMHPVSQGREAGASATDIAASGRDCTSLLRQVQEWMQFITQAPPITDVNHPIRPETFEADHVGHQRETAEAYKRDFEIIWVRLSVAFCDCGLSIPDDLVVPAKQTENASLQREREQNRLVKMLEWCEARLKEKIFDRGEILVGWEPDPWGRFPSAPIRVANDLRSHLNGLLDVLNTATSKGRASEWLEATQRELRNARLMLRHLKLTSQVVLEGGDPSNIHDAKRQLEATIDGLAELDDQNRQSANRSEWHDADDVHPDEFLAGPLTGTKEQLALWIMQDDDPRNLDTKLRNGIYWGRKDGRTKRSVWFRTQAAFAEANKQKIAPCIPS